MPEYGTGNLARVDEEFAKLFASDINKSALKISGDRANTFKFVYDFLSWEISDINTIAFEEPEKTIKVLAPGLAEAFENEKVELHVLTKDNKVYVLNCIPELKVKQDNYVLTKLQESTSTIKPIDWAQFNF